MIRNVWKGLAVVSCTTAIVMSSGTMLSAAQAGRTTHRVVLSGLDNPRQLSRTPDGRLVLALSGRGGPTGKLVVIPARNRSHVVMRRQRSFADADGSFALGLTGASKRPGGAFFAVDYPKKAPQGQRRDGWLLAKSREGHTHKVAIGRFERRHDPDGEGVESNPYSVLALQRRVLVADAAGDYIAQVKNGHIGVWAVLPEYGPQIDAVPTVLAEGHDGSVYVGELHSERRGEAKVWKYSRVGERLRSWNGFTTVTGVARTKDGTLYVSELFGGPCDPSDVPDCFPGRVVKVEPGGDRSYYPVPAPAGIVARGRHVWVSAYSVCPHAGCFGNTDFSGQVWHFTT